MSNEDAQSDACGNFTPKERLELERWAKLHNMSLAEYLRSDIYPDLASYRKRRLGTNEGQEQQGKAL